MPIGELLGQVVSDEPFGLGDRQLHGSDGIAGQARGRDVPAELVFGEVVVNQPTKPTKPY